MSGSIGVYRITCTVSNNIYIGSAARNIRFRWNVHRSELRAGRHINKHLQRAWNKYGEQAFMFEVIEVLDDPDQVVEREQFWLDHYRDTGACLYNIAPTAGSMLGFKMPQEVIRHKTYVGFVAPDGVLYNDIADLPSFCQEHGLNIQGMYAIASGRYRHHKGWIAITEAAQDVEIYGFIAPDGTRYQNIVQLTAFCRRFGLSPGTMASVFHGKRKQHKGWRALSWEEAMAFR